MLPLNLAFRSGYVAILGETFRSEVCFVTLLHMTSPFSYDARMTRTWCGRSVVVAGCLVDLRSGVDMAEAKARTNLAASIYSPLGDDSVFVFVFNVY